MKTLITVTVNELNASLCDFQSDLLADCVRSLEIDHKMKHAGLVVAQALLRGGDSDEFLALFEKTGRLWYRTPTTLTEWTEAVENDPNIFFSEELLETITEDVSIEVEDPSRVGCKRMDVNVKDLLANL